ncbi:hypothetical protein AB0M46_13690 [Dactylosporangium sp. NPDC051485]|uniref:hypothetical protein n=1 Tax=Dactylosporangium sp. NPDC051485 TaxID=3154846 RepID=UPI00342D305D
MTGTAQRLRAAVSLIVLAVAVAACATSPTPPAPTGSVTAPAVSAGSAQPDDHDHDHDGVGPTQPPSTGDLAAAHNAGQAFVTAWARPDLPASDWHATVAPLAVPAYANKLSTVDPSRVPATRVTGPAVTVSATASAVLLDVPTDAGTVRVSVVLQDRRWLVDDLAINRSAAPR